MARASRVRRIGTFVQKNPLATALIGGSVALGVVLLATKPASASSGTAIGPLFTPFARRVTGFRRGTPVSIRVTPAAFGLNCLANTTTCLLEVRAAKSLRAMLIAARRDGIVIRLGSGWRSNDMQKALRIANGCPDLHRSPASACRIPTARPGFSNHQMGLAADLADRNNRSIRFGSPEYLWLQQNAARFGWNNAEGKRAGEAWHWNHVANPLFG